MFPSVTCRLPTWATLLVTGASLLVAEPAAAQVSAQDAAAAEALYDEGTRRMESGDYAGACPKLAESFRLDPALGALLNLAVCRERARQTASAWVTYLDVVARAKAAGDAERATVAQQRADALAPRLPKLRIDLGPAVSALPGLTVTRDGTPVEPGVASTPVPVDPGDHVVVVRATGKAPLEKRVTAAEGAVAAVAVDALTPEEEGAAPPPPTRPPEETAGGGGLTGLQVTGLVMGGVGVVALGVGLAFGAVALGGGSDLDTLGYEPEDGSCTSDPEGQCASVYDDASSAATLSTVLVIAGGALAATGLVLVIAGGDTSGQETARVKLVPSFGGAILRGEL